MKSGLFNPPFINPNRYIKMQNVIFYFLRVEDRESGAGGGRDGGESGI